MLWLRGESFTSGVSDYYGDDPSRESELHLVHVNIVIEADIPISTTARLDTATPWVILNAEINRRLGLRPSEPMVALNTAVGRMVGSLERFPITLPAEEGDSLEIDATLFVCEDWDRSNFLGYNGFLERIRFALDPRLAKFYFGPFSEGP
ncbi:MAG: hypothetical protein OXP75_13080 [Rhodospirillales bacterium]|nr:hypothetical protein [Rhodospirillales bacterium]